MNSAIRLPGTRWPPGLALRAIRHFSNTPPCPSFRHSPAHIRLPSLPPLFLHHSNPPTVDGFLVVQRPTRELAFRRYFPKAHLPKVAALCESYIVPFLAVSFWQPRSFGVGQPN